MIRTRIKIGTAVFDFDRPPSFVRKSENRAIVEAETGSGKINTSHFFDRAGVTLDRRFCSPMLEGMLREIWFLLKGGATCELWIDLDAPVAVNMQGGRIVTNNWTPGTGTGAFTFTRASKSTVIAPHGFLVDLANDVPGITRGRFTNGIEIFRTNINRLLFSNDFSNAAWTKTNATASTNVNDVLDPRGGFTANRIDLNSAGALVQQTTASPVSTTSWTFSAFVKAAVPGQQLDMYVISTIAGNLRLQSVILSNDWQLAFASFISPGSTAGNAGVKLEMSAPPKTFFIYGAQLEPHLSIRGPSPYVETTTGAFTRQFDNLRVAMSALGIFGSLRKGTISFWYKRSVNELFLTTKQYLFYIENTTLSSNKWIALSFENNDLVFDIQNVNDSEFGLLFSIESLLVSNAWQHYAVTWDTDIANGQKIYFEGVLRITSNNAAFLTKPFENAANLNIGSTNSGASGAEGVYSDFMIFPRVLSADEILDLKTQSGSMVHERNFYPSLLLDQDSYSPALLQGNALFDVTLALKENL